MIDITGNHKMFHANMLRKYNTRMTVELGMVMMCGSRHLELIDGGDSIDETPVCDTLDDGIETEGEEIKYCQ